jgi:quercetin dioxygenase-like cupin family protein
MTLEDGVSARLYDWSSVEKQDVYPGITRQAVVAGGSTVVRYIYEPGCHFPDHQHPEEQVTVVHSGEIEFTVAGAPVIMRAGQVAVIPGHVPHGARVTAGETVVTDNYFATADRTPIAVVGDA